jgi:hypothetical protein
VLSTHSHRWFRVSGQCLVSWKQEFL